MKKKKKTQVPFRLNILFFLVFIMFSALILRLGVVQIVNGERYQQEVDRTENKIVSTPVPRGKIFDRNNNTIVDNEPQNAITYTRAQGVKQEEVLEVAEKLAGLIKMNPDKLTERDIKDYWLLSRPDEARAKLTEDDLELSAAEQYQLQLDRITEEELSEIADIDPKNSDGTELEIAAIFREMNKGYALTPQIVKNKDVTDKEYAIVSENLEALPGIGTTVDWNRKNTYGLTLSTILGKTTTSDEGLPREMLDHYLSRGYNRNDRVGKSYLEAEYEEVLTGQKAKIENITQGHTVVDTKVISEGQRGNDLVLSIDMELQKAVEEILEEELSIAKSKARSNFLDRAFVVMMNPKTGEVLTLAGKQYTVDDGKVEYLDYALGTINSAYAMGSSVKGATVLTGYQAGVLHNNKYYYDAPMYINTLRKASYQQMGNINELEALKRSSNVYMFRTVIDIAKGRYVPRQPLPIDISAWGTIRNYFSQFGLGVKTGIDLPGEATGVKGSDVSPGLLMDLSIGQYDTYTPLQMAQYVSTIANGGYRMQPKIVKEIRQPTLNPDEIGPIIQPFKPTVLNRIDMSEDAIERVQEGFRQVMQEPRGTAYEFFKDRDYRPAGKTGTAEGYYFDPVTQKGYNNVWNLTLVGYAPHDNPEVAFSVVVPNAYYGASNNNPISNRIGQKILDQYFKLKANKSDQADTETAE
ncbi:peptidoglycan D,D-transpeptidase FtsI family protein [Litchfieldia alkalitelluris]|uniref:peptidoglycan D,D-transpeptidase FtsI family protein n=1 Tax=Litchfieldia alkalitelluris TaxID=304268 RepID=UPI0009968425|nr:penicillin-binding protein 2 [Litchfieldia alkalitelluris]